MKARNIIQVEEDATLYQYLDSMLSDVTEATSIESEGLADHEDVIHQTADEITETAYVALPAEVVDSPVAEENDESIEPAVDLPAYPLAFLNSDNKKVLVFMINGKRMAVPTKSINGVIKWDESIAQLPYSQDYSLGVIKNHDQTVEVLNTEMLLMGDYYQEHEAKFNRIVLFDGGQYGLACQEIDAIDEFDVEKISWRVSRAKRPWFAGVEVSSMCLVIDINEIVTLIS